MAAHHGKEGTIKFTPSGGAQSLVLIVTDWEVDPVVEIKDGTGITSGGNRQKIKGLHDWKGKMTILEETLPGAGEISGFDLIEGMDGAFEGKVTGSRIVFRGAVIINEPKLKVTVEDVVSWDVSFEGTGGLARV